MFQSHSPPFHWTNQPGKHENAKQLATHLMCFLFGTLGDMETLVRNRGHESRYYLLRLGSCREGSTVLRNRVEVGLQRQPSLF